MKNEKGIVIVIEGPSGVGKDALVKKLIEKHPNMFEKVPSMTTREMRENESQGNPYYFVDEKTFLSYINNGQVFEHTTRHNTYRGMSKHLFDEILARKNFPIKDCDVIGLNALKKIYGKNVVSVFITCPKNLIEERLIKRGETGESLKIRLNNYDEYINNKIYFDYNIENIDLNKAADELYKIILKFYNSL